MQISMSYFLSLHVAIPIYGYVAYPLGLQGVVVCDVRSAIRFHLETFGPILRELPSVSIKVWAERRGSALCLPREVEDTTELGQLEQIQCLPELEKDEADGD